MQRIRSSHRARHRRRRARGAAGASRRPGPTSRCASSCPRRRAARSTCSRARSATSSRTSSASRSSSRTSPPQAAPSRPRETARVRAGRQHDPARVQRAAGDGSADPEGALRRAEGPGAGDHHVEPAERARRQRRAADQDRLPSSSRGRRRIRASSTTRRSATALELAPQRRAAEVDGGHRRGARAVQRLAARGAVDRAGRDADDLRGDAAAAGADPGGQAAPDRRDDAEALPAAARPAAIAEIGLPGLRGARVERARRAGRHAARRSSEDQRRGRRDPEGSRRS